MVKVMAVAAPGTRDHVHGQILKNCSLLVWSQYGLYDFTCVFDKVYVVCFYSSLFQILFRFQILFCHFRPKFFKKYPKIRISPRPGKICKKKSKILLVTRVTVVTWGTCEPCVEGASEV
ncbi:hypothetical protein D1007_12734 [Hordeum vulgare]|nr:hypothetical protein D1007_12734 [Hordeum vulgare]